MEVQGLERLKSLHYEITPQGFGDLIVEDSFLKPWRGDTRRSRPMTPENSRQAEDWSSTHDKSCVSNLREKAELFLQENPIDGQRSKVFIGNISYKVRESELRDFFEYFGKVLRVQIIRDWKTRRSRGIGFVMFASPLDAKKAIDANPFELFFDGRQMNVHWAERKKTLQAKRQLEIIEREKELKQFQDVVSEYTHVAQEGHTKRVQDSDQDSPIMCLTDDALAYIFSFLGFKDKVKVERVCKRWCVVVKKTWLHVDHVDFQGIFKPFQGTGGLLDKTLISILRRTYRLKSLDLSSSPHYVTPYGLRVIGDYCRELQYLDLSGTSINGNCMRYIASNCTKLKTVILTRCLQLGEKGLWWLIKCCKELEYLKVMDSVPVTGQCFYLFGPNLHTLILNDLQKITDTSLSRLADACRENVLELDLTGCKALSDQGFIALFEGCNKLKTLRISQEPYQNNSRGLQKVGLLTALVELDLSWTRYVNDDVLYAISSGCKSLRILNIEGCYTLTEVGLATLVAIEGLQVLNVSYLLKMTDEITESIASHGQLQVFLARSCRRLSNNALLALLFWCENIYEADFSCCRQIDDSVLHYDGRRERGQGQPEVKVYVGSTKISKSALESLGAKHGRCVFLAESRSVRTLGYNRDYFFSEPFYASEDEDDDLV